MADSWLVKLQHWIKQLFRPKKKPRTYPKIIKRWDGTDCSVLRIERDTSGEKATYRIVSVHGQCDYLITLDYLRELHTELVGTFQGTPIRISTMEYQRNSVLTHRFAVWRVWRNGVSDPLGIWDVDLEGNSQRGANFAELASRNAVKMVALSALVLGHVPQIPFLHWEAQMERIDWLALLEEKIREQLSNDLHNLRACAILQDGL
ncbi:hypothetical protein [Nostoc sp. TCL240-02]|uniref:hypothetical protein n=1 Tax=Nostoc sp. TCL240-02 TaxID=2572090 RepID=UPI00157FA7D8|nr:hypothetical protein [Nostoc sp. TCL240-02]QKQ75663.1 hypothetical protein FBB35_22310 [Nostoc sp. TCL240-02]